MCFSYPRECWFVSAHKAASFMLGWVVGCSHNLSFYCVSVLEKCEDGFRGPQISGLSSLEPLKSLNYRALLKNCKWFLICQMPWVMLESWNIWGMNVLFLFIALPSTKQLGFNLHFCILNHIYGPDIVSPNGDNTHHRESNVSWENITLRVNWLIETDCIYNSPGANTFSRAGLKPYVQRHQKGKTLTTQFMEFT